MDTESRIAIVLAALLLSFSVLYVVDIEWLDSHTSTAVAIRPAATATILGRWR